MRIHASLIKLNSNILHLFVAEADWLNNEIDLLSLFKTFENLATRICIIAYFKRTMILAI